MRGVGKQQLEVDRLGVGGRIDAPIDVHRVRVLKRAHHVDQRVAVASSAEEFISEALAAVCSSRQPSNIDPLDCCWHRSLRARKSAQVV